MGREVRWGGEGGGGTAGTLHQQSPFNSKVCPFLGTLSEIDLVAGTKGWSPRSKRLLVWLQALRVCRYAAALRGGGLAGVRGGPRYPPPAAPPLLPSCPLVLLCAPPPQHRPHTWPGLGFLMQSSALPSRALPSLPRVSGPQGRPPQAASPLLEGKPERGGAEGRRTGADLGAQGRPGSPHQGHRGRAPRANGPPGPHGLLPTPVCPTPGKG